MFRSIFSDTFENGSKASPTLRLSGRFLDQRAFGLRAVEEARRHARYLTGFALLRLSSKETGTLEETLALETRRTDALCALEDGSFGVLLTHANEPVCRRVVDRLAAELSAESEESTLLSGFCAAGNRRLDADELWAEATRLWALSEQQHTHH